MKRGLLQRCSVCILYLLDLHRHELRQENIMFVLVDVAQNPIDGAVQKTLA